MLGTKIRCRGKLTNCYRQTLAYELMFEILTEEDMDDVRTEIARLCTKCNLHKEDCSRNEENYDVVEVVRILTCLERKLR